MKWGISKKEILGASILLFLLAYYTVFAILAEKRAVEVCNEAYWTEHTGEGIAEKAEMHRVPGYGRLLEKKGLTGALARMAADDSVGLFLNLPDSCIQLLIKGVCVQEIPVREIKMSPFFREIDVEVLYDLLASPLKITTSDATIDKEPIQVVQAPRDSSDAIPVIQPDTSHAEPVFFLLHTDKIYFYFYQSGDKEKNRWTAFKFGLSDRFRRVAAIWRGMLTATVPEYQPRISIGVSRENAKVIYRAIPLHGRIVVTT